MAQENSSSDHFLSIVLSTAIMGDIPLVLMLGATYGFIMAGMVLAFVCFFSQIFSLSAWLEWIAVMAGGTLMSIFAMIYEKKICHKRNTNILPRRFNGFALILALMSMFSIVLIIISVLFTHEIFSKTY